MKKRSFRYKIVLLAALMFLGIFGAAGRQSLQAEPEKKKMDFMFLHDTHSHLNSFSTVIDGESTKVGGFAKIAHLIAEQKKKNPDTVVLDGGDFSMGTLVQTVYESEAAELRMLGVLGCDVTTLGNHEFDYRSKGLSNMLKAAAASGDAVPELVLCNVDWEAMEEQGLSEGQQLLKDGFTAYDVKDYVILNRGGVNIAVTGVFGTDALSCAPTCELLFKDPVTAVKETVKKIQETEQADMIVCVSHSGTWEKESRSEDEILAKGVPELDLIVSAHTHTQLAEPIVHGNTYIVSAGEYGKSVGSLHMESEDSGRWKLENYELIPVTEDVPSDAAAQQKIDEFLSAVDENYLASFGYKREQVLAQNDVKFSDLQSLSTEHTEHNLGSLIADAYIYAVTGAADFDGTPVDVAVVPSGTVRDTYTVGDITTEDVFNSFSLGTGADGVPGYPLISVYLTGKELKMAAEIDASVSDFMTTARLYMSGLHFSYNPNRMILNKVTDVSLVDDDGARAEIEDEKLYRVVADLYSGQMLGAVTDMSRGILSLIPKHKDGTPVENFEDAIIRSNGKELKAWAAIAEYMESFPDTDGDGISNVPDYYAKEHGRKVVQDSKNIVELVKKPNKFAVILGSAAVILIAGLVLLIVFFTKKIRRSRKKSR